MSWSPRQSAMLACMGIGHWPAEWSAEEGVAPGAVATPAPTAPPAPAATSAVLPPPARSWSSLEALHADVRACRACGLCAGRTQAVPGIGHAQAHWMVIGEGPGEQEDAQGEPFVGPSGQLLDAMLSAVGRSRQPGSAQQQVFIANTVKCRPPGNRNPAPEELAACAPFLQGQLALVKPRLVLALGRFAAQSLLQTEAPIGRLRGQAHALPDGTPVVVSYHPSYLLRQPQDKAKAWEDLCLAAEVYEERQNA
jgi:uracil-DNA glycosylase